MCLFSGGTEARFGPYTIYFLAKEGELAILVGVFFYKIYNS